MPIPIQNVYYLLSYAWDKVNLRPDFELAGGEGGAHLVNLLAQMVLPEIQFLMVQGLVTDYVRQTRTIRGIKGKLLLPETIRQALPPGQTVCAVEERSANVLPNQLIKAALTQLLQTADLAPEWQRKAKTILPAFAAIQMPPAGTEIGAIRNIPRSQAARYRFVLDACACIRQNLLPVAGGRGFTLRSFVADKKQMGDIFEAFVRNFYRREQTRFRVKSEKIYWQGHGTTTEAQHYLPAMFTDISLQAAARKIIIDTKFYKKALLPHYQKEKLISRHLYQLFTYLQNSPKTPAQQLPEGILLYPVVNQELNLEYTLSGHQVRICTINLNQPWPNIKSDLLQLIA